MSLNDVFICAHTVMPAVSSMSGSPTFDIENKTETVGANLKFCRILQASGIITVPHEKNIQVKVSKLT